MNVLYFTSWLVLAGVIQIAGIEMNTIEFWFILITVQMMMILQKRIINSELDKSIAEFQASFAAMIDAAALVNEEIAKG